MLENIEELQNHLSENEKVLWVGKPRAGIFFRSSDIFMIPFSLLLGYFAFTWESGAITGSLAAIRKKQDPLFFVLFFPLFGIPLVLFALHMIFGRFWVDVKRRKKTMYAITNERVLILSGILRRKITSLNLGTLSDISLTEKPDNSGTISFGRVFPFSSWYDSLSMLERGQYTTPRIEFIDNAREVYNLICKAQKEYHR